MDRWVEISFDCLPLRSVGRVDVPLDASPKYQRRCEQVKLAIERHGAFNTYYLYDAQAVYHLTNDAQLGTLQFSFEGTVLTNQSDDQTKRVDLEVQLEGDVCDWLTQPIVQWFQKCVQEAVKIEFDRYIVAGDLQKTRDRIGQIAAESDEVGGFLGMYL
jgi:hypothetical protein